MTWQAWASILLMFASVVTMARGLAGPDMALTGAMTCLLLLGILTPGQAAEGFGNEGMLTVAVLFVVAAGIESTGAMDWVVRRVLGRPKSTLAAQTRMMVPVAAMSAFLNNTPVVAMMLPYSIGFLVFWSLFLMLYWLTGLPLGLQASYHYPPG